VALKRYEERIRGFVDDSQSIALGGKAPMLANPQTEWGIWALRWTFKLLAASGVWKWFDTKGEGYKVADYPKMGAIPKA
jgi:hypothetical protein